jgi:hypothetical protein
VERLWISEITLPALLDSPARGGEDRPVSMECR